MIFSLFYKQIKTQFKKTEVLIVFPLLKKSKAKKLYLTRPNNYSLNFDIMEVSDKNKEDNELCLMPENTENPGLPFSYRENKAITVRKGAYKNNLFMQYKGINIDKKI